MSTQRYAYFLPATGEITLYRTSDNGFNYNFSVKLSELSEEQQGEVSASLAWLTSQLEDGEVVSQVIFETFIYTVGEDEDIEQATGLDAAVTGRKVNGAERTVPIRSTTIPPENSVALLGLWESLANFELPELEAQAPEEPEEA